MMKVVKRGCVLLVLGLFSVAAFSSPPLKQCPQPRFTERAPGPEYALVNPLSADKAGLAAGKRLYVGKDGNFGCANCHGKKGEGDGPLASQSDPAPRNFACAQTVNEIPDGQLFWIIRNGSPGTWMPAHPYYSDTDVWHLVLYLRFLARP